MPVFQIKKKKLLPVKEKRFNLERDLQKLVEDNLKTLFGLEFVSSEFPIEEFYIDTLAFDPETNAFTIIEYKKDKSLSIVDQGLHYLSLLHTNKSDFVLALSEKKNKFFKKQSIDWQSSKVIFIARSFSERQVGSTNFRNFPIELWQAALYEGGLFDITLIETERTGEPITEVVKDSKTRKIAETIKEFTEQDHKRNGSPKTREWYGQLKTKILDLDERIKVHITRSYIAFKTKETNFVYTRIQSTKLVIDIRIDKPKQVPGIEIKKNTVRAWDTTPSWRTYIKRNEDIRKVMDFIEQSYNYYEKKYS